MKRSPLDYAIVTAKGICMGIADVIPGVSGGTIAFITGIYEELVESIRAVSTSLGGELLKGRVASFWTNIHGSFLTALLAGIALSVLALSRLILHLLEHHPIPVWSFFFGLIVASAIVILQKIHGWHGGILLSFPTGAVAAYFITAATPAETPTDSWFVFLSGAVAICAMILPGISGSFILLLLGKYEYVLGALRDVNIGVILVFGAGCASGLLAFAHLLSWLLRRHHDLAVALLSGFMIGSLNKVWPWKQTVETMINSKGVIVPLVQVNVLPNSYLELTGISPQLGIASGVAIIGALLVVILERLGSRKQ